MEPSEEQARWEEAVKDNRLKEQQENKDYDYDENGAPQKCDDCHSFINSDGHCPLCDY